MDSKKFARLMPMLVGMTLMVIALFYVITGTNMHNQVLVEEDKFHTAQDAYFSIAKTERDAAATGSELNDQLVEIQQYPSELLRLKLVGVGQILTGIFVVLIGIMMALMMMPTRLGRIIYGFMDEMEK